MSTLRLLVLLFAFILTVLKASHAEDIYLERGKPGIISFEAPIAYHYCVWSFNDMEFISSETKFPGYSVRFSENKTCDLFITTVRANDSGKWDCDMAGNIVKHFNVIAAASSKSISFVYNNKKVKGKVQVYPDPTTGDVNVSCVTDGGYPKPSTTWIVNEAEVTENILNEDWETNSTFLTNSTIRLEFQPKPMPNTKFYKIPKKNPGQWEKRVTCIAGVEQIGTSQKIDASFIQAHPTTAVTLTQEMCDSSKKMKVVCDSDGFPEPTSYELQQIDPTMKTLLGEAIKRAHPTIEVKTAGLYKCKASNTFEGKTHSALSDEKTVKPCGQDKDPNNNGLSLRPEGITLMMIVTSVVALLRNSS